MEQWKSVNDKLDTERSNIGEKSAQPIYGWNDLFLGLSFVQQVRYFSVENTWCDVLGLPVEVKNVDSMRCKGFSGMYAICIQSHCGDIRYVWLQAQATISQEERYMPDVGPVRRTTSLCNFIIQMNLSSPCRLHDHRTNEPCLLCIMISVLTLQVPLKIPWELAYVNFCRINNMRIRSKLWNQCKLAK